MSQPGADVSLGNPQPGDVLAGKYRVESVLGKGGMGVVVSATHTQLGQRVAIKYLLRPDVTDIVARFLREARAAVRLRNEHVARVLDVGEFDNGAPYMVMEYLEGGDLSHHLKATGPLPITEAIEYVLQTCEAIAEAHSLGIIHRDLKPANLFLMRTPDGSKSVKVLDFGISKVNDNDDQSGDGMQLTKTEMVLGSPLYMSPEQLKSSRDVDPRSDLWALGVILYQLLVGKVPFNASAFSELILKVNLEPPAPISQFRADVPPALEAAVLKCLEKHRDNRFHNVAEFALAIAAFGSPTAPLSAEKARRVLESAGVKVDAPPPSEISSSAKSLPAVAITGPMQTSSPSAPPSAADAAGLGAPDTQSSQKTVALSGSGRTLRSGESKGKRGAGLIAVAALGLAIVGAAAFFATRPPAQNTALAAPSAEMQTATAMASARAVLNEPEGNPVPAATPPEVPAPSVNTSASAPTLVASAASKPTTAPAGGKSSQPKIPANGVPATNKPENPLNVGIDK